MSTKSREQDVIDVLSRYTTRDGRWSATLTERGRHYLDNGRYPAVTGTTTATAGDLPGDSSTQAANGGTDRQPAAQPSVIQEATVLIERLQTGGGTVVVSDSDADTRASYRRAIHAAKQHNLVPDGYDLRHAGRNTGDLVVRLYSATQPYDTDWNRLRLYQGDIRATPPADYGALEQDPTNLQVFPPATSGSKSGSPSPISVSPGATPRPRAWNSRPVESSPASSRPSKSRNRLPQLSGSVRRNGRPRRDLPNNRQPRSAAAATSNARRGGSTPSRKPTASPSRSTAGRHSPPRWKNGGPPRTCGRSATPSNTPPPPVRRPATASSPPG